MQVSAIKMFAGAVLALALGACASSPPRYQVEALEAVAYEGEPIAIDAERITVAVESRSFAAGAPGEAEFLVPPEQVARLWPERRLRAAGGSNEIQYVIRNVAVSSNRTHVGEAITVVIDVQMIVSGSNGSKRAETNAQVQSIARLSKGASAMVRWQALQMVSRDLAMKLDRKLTEAVGRDLAGYVMPTTSKLVGVESEVAPVPIEAVQPTSLTAGEPTFIDADLSTATTLPEYETVIPTEPSIASPISTPVLYVEDPVVTVPPTEVIYEAPVLDAPDDSMAQTAPVAATPEPSEVILPLPVSSPAPEVRTNVVQTPTPAPKKKAPVEQASESPSLFRGGDLTKGMFLPGSSSFPALPE